MIQANSIFTSGTDSLSGLSYHRLAQAQTNQNSTSNRTQRKPSKKRSIIEVEMTIHSITFDGLFIKALLLPLQIARTE